MYDMAFTAHTLRKEVRRIDFLNYPDLRADGELDRQIELALTFADLPAAGLASIRREALGKSMVSRVSSYSMLLVLRKLNANIVSCSRLRSRARDAIAQSLYGVLSEAVPFRIYKLDVRRFFESIDRVHVEHAMDRIGLQYTMSARLINQVIAAHHAAGGEGLPRGLSISGTLADLVLGEFDAHCEDEDGVFFYRRYVDDITLITSGEEDSGAFAAQLETRLPKGLNFKKSKIEVRDAASLPLKVKAGLVPRTEQIDYLGYKYKFEAENFAQLPCGHRRLHVDIASKKVRKIKTRVIKSLLDFLRSGDFDLLDERLRHLTSNLSMVDRSSGMSRLVGIHFNYPLVDAAKSEALIELDRFLKHALSSPKGKLFKRTYVRLSPAQRARLLRHSFVEGAEKKKFFQMGLRKLGQVQRCWKYA